MKLTRKWFALFTSGVALWGMHCAVQSQAPAAEPRGPWASANDRAAAILGPEAFDARGRLSLPYLIQQAQQFHPLVQAARLDVQASEADLLATQRQKWPTFSAHLENRPSQVNTAYTQIVRVQQTLWDAGRTEARIEEAQTTLDANALRVSMAAIQMGVQVVNAWQQFQVADARLSVATTAMNQLTSYRLQMQRRVESQASPVIDLELATSRLFQAHVDQVQATHSRQIALNRLAQFTGLRELFQPALPAEAAHDDLTHFAVPGLDWHSAALSHPSVLKAQQDRQAALLRLKAKQAEQFPQIYVRLDRPLNAVNNSATGVIGLSYTPGAGLATGIEAQALGHRSASLAQAVEAAQRDIAEVLYTDRQELESAKQRIQVLRAAVRGAQLAVDSFHRQFASGRKTWLDLLNASRELTQSQYALADSHADVAAAWHRLALRTAASGVLVPVGPPKPF